MDRNLYWILLPKRNTETTEETEGEAAGETDSQSPDSETAEQSNQSSQTTASEDEETEETEESDQASKWQSPADVPDDVLEQAKRIEFTVVPSEKAQDRQHAFKIRVETEGELYVRIAKGVRASGDYRLAEDYNAVVPVPQLPREVQIEGQGGLLVGKALHQNLRREKFLVEFLEKRPEEDKRPDGQLK